MKKAVLLFCLFGLLQGCSHTIKQTYQSDNFDSRVRFLVIHYTTGNWSDSLDALTKGQVSAHYLIPEKHDPSFVEGDLAVYRLVDEQQRAWHAGVSAWQGRENINDQSIGIELVNRARCVYEPLSWPEQPLSASQFDAQSFCLYPSFDQQQISLLIDLATDILTRYPNIDPTSVVGHSDIQLGNKQDPGPHFPWYTLYQHGIGAWYDDDTVFKYWQQFKVDALPDYAVVQCALQRYGYGIEVTGEYDKQTFDTLKAFQLHFLPWQVTGEASPKTIAVLWALMEKYREGVIERHCMSLNQ